MYAGEAVAWLGWALFYGSPAVWAGLATLCAAWAEIVGWEERRLLERFGDRHRVGRGSRPDGYGGQRDAHRRNICLCTLE